MTSDDTTVRVVKIFNYDLHRHGQIVSYCFSPGCAGCLNDIPRKNHRYALLQAGGALASGLFRLGLTLALEEGRFYRVETKMGCVLDAVEIPGWQIMNPLDFPSDDDANSVRLHDDWHASTQTRPMDELLAAYRRDNPPRRRLLTSDWDGQ